jgi:hypothetical protein
VSGEVLVGRDSTQGGVVHLAAGVSVKSSAYEHREYDPLVNARAHQLGKSRVILNRSVDKQYRKLLEYLCHKNVSSFTANDYMAVTYHLLLQVGLCECASEWWCCG